MALDFVYKLCVIKRFGIDIGHTHSYSAIVFCSETSN